MLDVLQMIISFIIAISIIIAIHEFGHFWVAKKLGVKVLRYSIGFGRPLYKFVAGKDKTEYVLAAVPLGGYVKMLDEREGNVQQDEIHRAFNRQSVWKRFAIVFAGPAFNFLFAIVAFWLMMVNGVVSIKPVIGEIIPETPAAIAGLKAGDQIVRVNNKETPIWPVIMEELLPVVIDKGEATISVRHNGYETDRTISYTDADINLDELDVLAATGLKVQRIKIKPIVGEIVANSPAARSELKPNDHIIRINDNKIDSWSEISEAIKTYAGKEVLLTVERDGARKTFSIIPASETENGKEFVRVGIRPARQKVPEEYKATYQYSMFEALGKSVESTANFTGLMFKFLGKLVTLDISIKNLSSPIGIARYAGISAEAGLSYFFMFLAQISISIGILNLLPIPLLDGGHLFFYLIEIVRGKPVSEDVEFLGQRIGLALLLTLMSVAVYNDLIRLFE